MRIFYFFIFFVLRKNLTVFILYCYRYLNIMDRAFRATTISAVKASAKRSMQLGGVSPHDIEHKYNL